MSATSVFDVLDFVESHPELSSNEVLVLITLANRTNKHTGYAYPSLANIQKTAHITTRTISSVLRSLEKKNLVETIPAPKYGPSTYRLLIPRRCQIDSTKRQHEIISPPHETISSKPLIQPKEGEKPSRARDVEDREKTAAELAPLPGSNVSPHKLGGWFSATPGTDFYNACLNGNHHHANGANN